MSVARMSGMPSLIQKGCSPFAMIYLSEPFIDICGGFAVSIEVKIGGRSHFQMLDEHVLIRIF